VQAHLGAPSRPDSYSAHPARVRFARYIAMSACRMSVLASPPAARATPTLAAVRARPSTQHRERPPARRSSSRAAAAGRTARRR
jgi:hypothetical protein